MSEPLKPPYVEKVVDLEGIQVWVVDGMYIRGHLDEEFTNFGQHYCFPFIPENEFWIDHEKNPQERRFFIEHLLVEHRLMAAGWPYSKAHADSSRLELRCRRYPDELHHALADEDWT